MQMIAPLENRAEKDDRMDDRLLPYIKILQGKRPMICMFSSDIAEPTMAQLCEAVNMRGVSSEVVGITATKHRFRACHPDAGRAWPKSIFNAKVPRQLTSRQFQKKGMDYVYR